MFLGHKMQDEYIEMGNCSKPHGIKGEFLFNLFNPLGRSLKKGSPIKLIPSLKSSSLNPDGDIKEIETIRYGNKVIVKIKDINDRNEVESLIPFTIWLERSHFEDIDEDEVFLSDLLGLNVFDTDNNQIGVVKNFYDNGAQAVLVIKLDEGSSVELPFVEAFFPEVDLDGEKITMINPGEI